MIVAELIILTNVSKRYSYQVPDTVPITVGDFVDVVFAKRKQVGLVVHVSQHESSDFSYTLSSVLSRHSKRPAIPQLLIHLVQWFSNYYCVTEYVALQCIVGLKKQRDSHALILDNPSPLPDLNEPQLTIYQAIVLSDQSEHLIHGVTGSGKTLIYAHLIRHVLSTNKPAIVLIPEISLTPQFTDFFSSIFDGVAVVHSGLTPKRKEIIWMGCLRGDVRVVIGPRSAIFMPLENLGLIIIDEEHDASYKQENAPRYYTHDIARERARYHNAQLIFGSATPSLGTYARISCKASCYHRLIKRYKGIPMPKVTILDLTAPIRNHLIHDGMIEGIEQTLKKNQKVLILVNRRGYSSFLKCRSCGEVLQCSQCETSFTYHSDGILRCHRCGNTKKMTRQCPSCLSYDLEYSGVAIQKIEAELRRLFSSSVVHRIDRDVIKNYDQLQSSLHAFRDDSHILIGTQMVSKGHNFPNLGFVGMIGVDTMLNFPDYRSTERMFQLMTQTAGRAGRDIDASDVMIQTYLPNHYVFDYVKHHDVDAFLTYEMTTRKALHYPPYSHIINVIFSGKKQSIVESMYTHIQQFNQSLSDLTIQAIGPKVAPIEKVSGYYRHNVFYKIDGASLQLFKNRLHNFPKKREIRLVVDINPMSLL